MTVANVCSRFPESPSQALGRMVRKVDAGGSPQTFRFTDRGTALATRLAPRLAATKSHFIERPINDSIRGLMIDRR